MSPIDVLVIGACMTDLTAYAERLPKLGETVHGHNFMIGFGGKGANQCVTAARLGASTALISSLGNDTFGKSYLENLKNHNIDITHTKVVNKMSGIAHICVTDKGDNQIIIIPGANDELKPADVLRAEQLIKNAKVAVFGFETPLETTLAGMELCKKYNCLSILNAAPARSDVDDKFLRLADVFCVNESEAEISTGLTVSSVSEAKNAAKKLLAMGCTLPIITLGDKGVVFASKEVADPVHVPVGAVKPVDTVGAGDVFVGAMAYFLAKHGSGLSTEEVVRRSCDIAKYSVQRIGTQASFPYAKDLPPELFT